MKLSKRHEGRTIGYERINAENLQLREEIIRRNRELEEKNRELEIETSLERVRSRSMAMHKTSELQEVINTVHEQLLHLNIPGYGGSFIAINKDVKDEIKCWGFGGTAKTSEEISIPHFNMPFCTNLMKGIKSGPGFFTEEFSQKEKQTYFRKLFKQKSWSELSYREKNEVLSSSGGYTRSVAVSKNTTIFIINHSGRKFTDAENHVLQRFANVFEQTYTRFLDLQKVEAQVREAKIEAALERVRSRSLDMHKSDELQDLVNSVFDQLKQLHIDMNSASIFIFEEGSKDWQQWVAASETSYSTYFHIPYSNQRIVRDLEKIKKAGKDFYTVKYSFAEKNKWFDYAFEHTDYRKISEKRQKYIKQGECMIISFALSKNTGIQITKYQGEKFSDKENEILRRIAKVFEQAYVRFLDLQKAEARARESQVEAALERVRSRSIGMHHTSELQEIVRIVSRELHKMEMDITGVFLVINNNEIDKQFTFWGSSGVTETYVKKAAIPFLDKPIYSDLAEATTKGERFFTEEFSREDKIEFFKHLFKYPPYNSSTPEWKNEVLSREGSYTRSVSVLNYTTIFVVNHYGRKLSDTDNNILKRFSRVFEQTYTRFLDLQKAEAQAREAKIETALERIRARTMGMQRSEELKEVIQLLFDQFVYLNINVEHTGFILDYKERDDMHIWLADKNEVTNEIFLPYFDCAHWNSFKKATAKGENFFANHLDLEEKNKFYRDLFKFIPDVPDGLEKTYLGYEGLAISTVLLDNVGLYIENFDGIPYSEEENLILMRFGKVFQQTYTRFLDLQKVEAQAREAQIEAAIEKVRNRSLAMHKTEELKEVVLLVFEKLHNLGVVVEGGVTISIYEPGTRDQSQWVAAPDLISSNLFRLPYTDDKIISDHLNAWESGAKFFEKTYSREDKDRMCEYLFSQTDFQYLPDEVKQMVWQSENYSQSIAFAKHSSIFINSFSGKLASAAEAKIMKRFARVFDQAYIRFLDLQKAEEQVFEAKIEAALEKIRSRTIGMQSSDELPEVASQLFKQIESLGLHPWSCGFNIFDHEKKIITQWVSSVDGRILPPFETPATEDIFKRIYEASKRSETLYIEETGGQQLVDTYNYMSSLPSLEAVFTELSDTGVAFPEFQVDHAAFFKHGYVHVYYL